MIRRFTIDAHPRGILAHHSRPWTLPELKRQNKAIGNHWFDAGAVRFFDSRIEIAPSWRQRFGLFLSSEQCHHSDGTSDPRIACVRQAMPDGCIGSVYGIPRERLLLVDGASKLWEIEEDIARIFEDPATLPAMLAQCEGTPDDTGHFANHYHVTGPSRPDGSDSYLFLDSRMGPEDGATFPYSVIYRDVLLAWSSVS